MYRFQIPGVPRGYTTHNRGARPSKAIINYWSYIEDVRKVAKMSARIPLPLESPKDEPLMIFTRCYFRDGRHPDPENVHKGIKDALFYQAKDGDKHTGGFYLPPLYDKKNPRVDVYIRPRCPEDDEIGWGAKKKKKMPRLSKKKKYRDLLGKLLQPGENGVTKVELIRDLQGLWDSMSEKERRSIWV